jgi:hypothetical protein
LWSFGGDSAGLKSWAISVGRKGVVVGYLWVVVLVLVGLGWGVVWEEEERENEPFFW